MSRICVVLALTSTLLATGCALDASVDDFDIGGDLSVPYETMEGPVTGNGLNPLDFWAPENRQALTALASGPLLTAQGALVPTPLLATPGGQSVLAHTLRCALPAGASIPGPAGVPFTGSIGLAPDWQTRGLTPTEQRWMTACLLQLLNGLAASVALMLEGSHPALDPRPGEDRADYVISDVTVFGNLFTPTPAAYVCVDPMIELHCDGIGWSNYTLLRLCGLSPSCGITPLTLCPLYCTRDANGDPACALPLGPDYPEAISSKVTETSFISLYPLCDLL